MPLNPAIFRNGEWVKTYGTTTHPLRYTYALSRGPLQDAAGAKAPSDITQPTPPHRPPSDTSPAPPPPPAATTT